MALVAPGQALLPPIRVLRGHDPLDCAEPVIEPARRVVKIVEKLLVTRGERLRLFPLRHVMKDQPRKTEADDRYNDDCVYIHLLPLGRERGFHGFKLFVDGFARLQVGDFFLEALGTGHAQRIGAALGEIGAALKHLEA